MKTFLLNIGLRLGQKLGRCFQEKYLVRYLVFIWFYGLVIAAFNDRYKLLLQETKSEIPYNGMLVQTERGYHFYDFTNLNFDITTQDLEEEISNDITIMPIAREEFALPNAPATQRGTTVSILKEDSLLVRNDMLAQIFDTNVRQNYLLMNSENDAVSVGKTGSIAALKSKEGKAALSIFYPACKSPLDIPLPAENEKVSAWLRARDIEAEKTVRLSSTEYYAVALNHDIHRRLFIIDLSTQKTLDLIISEFGLDQIHFIPRFINADTIAFSILGSEGNGTVLYNIKQGTHEILSRNFSDAIHVSRDSKIILAQSYHARSGNVPFGSAFFMQEQARYSRNEIMAAIGDDNALWRRLFQNPDDSRLAFHPDAHERLSVIEDPTDRERLEEYWKQVFDPTLKKEMELKLFEVGPQGLDQKQSIIYFLTETNRRLVWQFDITPLLSTLGFPDSVIDIYKQNFSENPNAYILTDLQ